MNLDTLTTEGIRNTWEEFATLLGGHYQTVLQQNSLNLQVVVPFNGRGVILSTKDLSGSGLFSSTPIFTEAQYFMGKNQSTYLTLRKVKFLDRLLRYLRFNRFSFNNPIIDNQYQLGGSNSKLLYNLSGNNDVNYLLSNYNDIYISMKGNPWWKRRSNHLYLSTSELITSFEKLLSFYDSFKTIIEVVEENTKD